MLRAFLILALLLLSGPNRAAEPDPAIHNELRALLQGLEQAVNTERYGDLAQYFSANMTVTTINQEVLTKPAEIAPYFQRWFGPGGYLKKLDMKLTADALTRLDPDKNYGVVTGSGLEKYILADGRSFDMLTRWTASVMKGDDGKWRILTLHIGTNFLDNPILTKAEASLAWFAAGGAGGGLVLGMLLMAFLKRRRS